MAVSWYKLKYPPEDKNRYTLISDPDCKLSVTRRNGDTYEVLFDLADLEAVKRYVWRIHPTKVSPQTYPVATVSGIQTPMARYLLNPPDDKIIEYLNGNGLDTRRSNIRISDYSALQLGKAKGVQHPNRNIYKPLDRKRYEVKMYRHSKTIWIGSYKTIKAARAARDKWIKEHDERRAK